MRSPHSRRQLSPHDNCQDEERAQQEARHPKQLSNFRLTDSHNLLRTACSSNRHQSSAMAYFARTSILRTARCSSAGFGIRIVRTPLSKPASIF